MLENNWKVRYIHNGAICVARQTIHKKSTINFKENNLIKYFKACFPHLVVFNIVEPYKNI